LRPDPGRLGIDPTAAQGIPHVPALGRGRLPLPPRPTPKQATKDMDIDNARRANGATAGPDYARRMIRKRSARWKKMLHTQALYRWHIRKLCPGRTLDVGCGIGRNLEHLGDRAVGVDHNESCIAEARSRGLTAFTSVAFPRAPEAVPGSYDSLLFAHVLEHMALENAVRLVNEYLPYLKPDGNVVIITPQERGFATDATHLTFVDHAVQRRIAKAAGVTMGRQYSFPLPRVVGRVFTYNEFVGIARLPERTG
jgi:2-polyprenyl-3-methyl-5-hydroxy-6-metoxy-1,4-benzoquinol methylase